MTVLLHVLITFLECFSCLAGGYPTPTYQWYKEEYENDRLVAIEIDPLNDMRITISGGMLIINNPEQVIFILGY